MSALVVDTSSWIAYFAGAPDDAQGAAMADVIEDALEEGRVHLSPVVAAELLSGTLRRREQRALEELFDDILLCDTNLEHWLRVGRLRAFLRSEGFSVSTPDAHVAQCALDLEGELLTADHIFAKIAPSINLQLVAP